MDPDARLMLQRSILDYAVAALGSIDPYVPHTGLAN